MEKKTNKRVKQNLSQIAKNNFYLLKLIIKATPWLVPNKIIFEMISQIMLFIEHVYIVMLITDAIQYERPFSVVLIYIICLVIAVIIKKIYTNIYLNYNMKKTEILKKNIQSILYDKVSTLDLTYYDNTNYYDNFVWCLNESINQTMALLSLVTKICSGITLLVISGYLFIEYDIIGLAFAVMAFIISYFTQSKISSLDYSLDVELIKDKRKRSYVNRIAYLNDYAKEIRLNNTIRNQIKYDYEVSNNRISTTIRKYSKRRVVYNFILDFVSKTFILNGLYVLYLVYISVVMKSISYGAIIALYRTSSWQFQEGILDLAGTLPEFMKISLYVEKLREFVKLEPQIRNKLNAKIFSAYPKEIKLRNVTFKYSGKSNYVLKNINMTIKPYEKIALVGYNGAGKTTLIKLLMRLYDPCCGEITVGGQNITDFTLDSYRDAFGVIFQDFKILAASIAENVSMDNDLQNNHNRIIDALNRSGFGGKLNSLEKGVDTQLTNEFYNDAIGLSGGEAQKVAIARVIYKNCGYAILDEPSSSLDPISEYSLNNEILSIAQDKTVIFISHRLSTTKMVDTIYMFEDGEIIEHGSHDELMKLNGKYAEIFNLQSGEYVKKS